jgi:hypothetical protein
MSALPIPSTPSKPATRKYQKNANGDYTCPHCIYTAHNMSTMHYHLKKHSGVSNYVCMTCNKQFLQKQTLELHIHARHPELTSTPKALPAAEKPAAATTSIKVHTCAVQGCEFSSLSKGNCRIHCMRIHYADYSNEYIARGQDGTCTCTVCDTEFKSLTHAYYHMASCLTESSILPTEDITFINEHVL